MERNINLSINVNSRKVTKFQDLVKIGDTITLTITILNGTTAADLTNQSIHVFLKKADNTKVEQTLSINGNIVSVNPLDSQASTAVGQVEGELIITDPSTNAQITSNTFIFNVEGSISDETLEASADSIQTLLNVQKAIDDYNSKANSLIEANTEADSKISTLEADIANANTAIQTLEADIATAKSSEFVNEITNARGTYNNLDARFDADEANITSNANSINSINTQLSEKANDIDSARTTTSKAVTGAINELNSKKQDKYDGMITDFNTALTQGYYQFGSSTLNQPNNNSGWGVVNIMVSDGGTYNNSNNWIWQIALFTDNIAGNWIRSKINTGAWSAWKQIATTEIGTITLLNGWGNQVGDTRISKTGNQVAINLVITGGVTTNNIAIANIPAGFRPLVQRYSPMASCGSDWTYSFGNALIGTDGNILIDSSTIKNTRLIFSATYTI